MRAEEDMWMGFQMILLFNKKINNKNCVSITSYQMPKKSSRAPSPSARLKAKKQKLEEDQRSSQPPKTAVRQTAAVTISENRQEIPVRDADGCLHFADHPNFRPNLTPKEVLDLGSFGGTYFRPIDSSVTGKRHDNEWKDLPEDWFKDLPAKKFKSARYDNSVNTYGVSCGGDLNMWESSGWIRDIDPYGWFQWYCRFYLGRRSSDDDRQIARGLGVFGPTGRWKRNLVNQCLSRVKDQKDSDQLSKVLHDHAISPKIRQLLQHWGYRLSLKDL
jgi:hypothetical protein